MLIAEDELYRLPAHFLHVKPRNVRVCLWQHHLSANELLDYARLYQPGLAEDIAATLHPTQRKRLRERISVGLLLTKVFGNEARVGYYESGRPFLKEKNESVEISISHSGDTYAFSLSDRRHGMDIEQWRDKAFALRTRFLNNEELEGLSLLAQRIGSEARAATLLWSAKESLYKAVDCPGLDFREDMLLQPHETKAQLTAYIRPLRTYFRIAYVPYPHCILTYTEPSFDGSVPLTLSKESRIR